MYPLAYTLMVFAVVLATGWSLWHAQRLRQQAHRAHLAQRVGSHEGVDEQTLEAVRRLPQAPAWMGPVGRGVRYTAIRAGRGEDLWLILQQIGVLAGLGAILVGVTFGWQGAAVGAVAGLFPLFRLHLLGNRRTRAIGNQLPDALDFIIRSLRAGHGFSDALQQACVELPSPIREELAIVAEMTRLGLPLRQGFERLIEANPENDELRLFASAVQLHRHTGGNLVEILEQLGETVRERLVFEHKVRALTSEVRMSSTILESLPVLSGAMLLVVAPGYLMVLFDEPSGRWALLAALVLMAIGALIMRRIARVEVT